MENVFSTNYSIFIAWTINYSIYTRIRNSIYLNLNFSNRPICGSIFFYRLILLPPFFPFPVLIYFVRRRSRSFCKKTISFTSSLKLALGHAIFNREFWNNSILGCSLPILRCSPTSDIRLDSIFFFILTENYGFLNQRGGENFGILKSL